MRSALTSRLLLFGHRDFKANDMSRRARDSAPASYCEDEEPALKRSKRSTPNPLRGRPTLTMVFEHDVRTHPPLRGPHPSAADVC